MDDDPFSGYGLRSVGLTDRGELGPCFSCLSEPLSDYTFSQLYTWRNSLKILWKRIEGHLCVFANGTGDLTLLLPPIGDTGGDRAMAAAFELMDDYNRSHGVPDKSRVEYASDELLSRFDRARYVAEPMGFDYVYDVRRMIDLAGGDLASKRQAKNRFLRNYDHRVERYRADRHLADCRALLDQWKAHQDVQHDETDETTAARAKRIKESTATDLCLESAEALGMEGLVVYVKSKEESRGESADQTRSGSGDSPATSDPSSFRLAGFTFGEPLGRDQSSITIEKTDLNVKGLAQFIFSEFCHGTWSQRPFVNVGDDWGLETLAWTKMSYRPVKLLQKYVMRKAPVSKVSVPVSIEPTGQPIEPLAGTTPLPVRVRVARKEDLSAAVELERACFSPSVSLKKRQLQYLQQRKSAIFLVAEQGDVVVGEGIALVRHHRGGCTGRIYSLAVNSGCRGQRIGQKLLAAMLAELTGRGAKRVYLEVEQGNDAAVRLYGQMGFRRIGDLPGYYGAGRDAIHMMIEATVGGSADHELAIADP